MIPPDQAALPGVYDVSRWAWFMGFGTRGQVLGEIKFIKYPEPFVALPQFRAAVSRHVQSQMAGGAGAIGATQATGDRGAFEEADAEAMRRSGSAHLLSISG